MALKLENSFSRLADPGLSTRASQILLGMTGNPNFTSPTPSVADFGVTLNSYITALGNCKEGDRVKIAVKNQLRDQVVVGLHSWALYVMLESGDDVAKALSSGFNISQAAQPSPPITKPEAPVLESGMNPGEIISRGKRAKGVIAFLHQYATLADMEANNWATITTTKSVAVIANLQPGTLYYCRLAVIGTKDQLVYSDVVSRIAV